MKATSFRFHPEFIVRLDAAAAKAGISRAAYVIRAVDREIAGRPKITIECTHPLKIGAVCVGCGRNVA